MWEFFENSEIYIRDVIIGAIAFILFPQNLHSPVDLENSSEQRKYISSILYKLKNIGKKSKKSRHLIQKGWLYEFLNLMNKFWWRIIKSSRIWAC